MYFSLLHFLPRDFDEFTEELIMNSFFETNRVSYWLCRRLGDSSFVMCLFHDSVVLHCDSFAVWYREDRCNSEEDLFSRFENADERKRSQKSG